MNEKLISRRKSLKSFLAIASVLGSSIKMKLAWAVESASMLSTKVKGSVILRDDSRYPLWRSAMSWYVFKPRRYPDVITQALDEQDVINTINHARTSGQKIAVRSTGHNPARAVLRNGGILLDLSRLRQMKIDPRTATAWVQPGLRAEELLHETTAHGLAFPAAHTGIVGLGGYLLGGGIGWNIPEYGVACRSILAADVVTADGKLVRVSRDSHADLFWALRGSGTGFFAAVTRYKLQLYPVHRVIKLNKYVLPIASLQRIIEAFAAIESEASPRLEMFIKVGRFYPFENSYNDRDLVFTVGFFAFGNSEDDAKALMAPVMESGIRDMSLFKAESLSLDYKDLYRPPETDYSSPNRIVVNNMWTNKLGEALSVLCEKMQKDPTPSPRSFLLGGWSMNNILEDASSCVNTAGKDYFSWYMIADNKQHIMPNYRWMDESLELTAQYANSRYLNETATDRYPHLARECFTNGGWEKLALLRKRFDPQGVFHGFPGHSSS